MRQKILNLLGLATRAGLLVSGEDTVIDAIQRKKAKIVFLGNDASSNTLDKFQKKCFFYKIELNTMFTSEDLSCSIGKNRMVLAILDEGFYKSIKKYLGGVENEG
jgi:ribosomal protein L7Ae-like RNA K-turn-binding protein